MECSPQQRKGTYRKNGPETAGEASRTTGRGPGGRIESKVVTQKVRRCSFTRLREGGKE